SLMDRADLVIIGQVSSVVQPSGAGWQTANVLVEDDLKGDAPVQLIAIGDALDPSMPTFRQGTKVLAFLKALPYDPNAGASYGAVDGAGGIFEIAAGSESSVRSALVPLLGPGATFEDLMGIIPSLKPQEPRLPPAFVGGLLREVRAGLNENDDSLLTQMACGSQAEFVLQARRWAVEQLPAQASAERRACLEGLAVSSPDLAVAFAATEALGEIGATASVPVLVSLLSPFSVPLSDSNLSDEDESMGQVSQSDGEDPEGSGQGDSTDESGPEQGGGLGEPNDDPTQLQLTGDEEASDTASTPDDETDGRPSAASPRGLGFADSVVLALGKVGDPAAVPSLSALMLGTDDFSLHSTVIHAFGLIGTEETWVPLQGLISQHGDSLLREQARSTLLRLAETQPQACGVEDLDSNGIGDLCDATPTPEPSRFLMLLCGVLGLGVLARRRRF
ncbi:MAG: hypothetical protein VCB25_06380, partial [Myxococcota bacterium]